MVALCAGCVDSFPTQDVVTVSPYEMTQAQRIEALNVLGARAGNRGRWRYAIDDSCVLSVSHRHGSASWATTDHQLNDASIETRFDKAEDSHYLELISETAEDPARMLASADRLSAQQGSLLLKLIKRDCRNEALSSTG